MGLIRKPKPKQLRLPMGEKGFPKYRDVKKFGEIETNELKNVINQAFKIKNEVLEDRALSEIADRFNIGDRGMLEFLSIHFPEYAKRTKKIKPHGGGMGTAGSRGLLNGK